MMLPLQQELQQHNHLLMNLPQQPPSIQMWCLGRRRKPSSFVSFNVSYMIEMLQLLMLRLLRGWPMF
jgi:hypothetical protein